MSQKYFEDIVRDLAAVDSAKPIAVVGNAEPSHDLSTEIDNFPTVIRMNLYWKSEGHGNGSGWVGKKITHRAVNSDVEDVAKGIPPDKRVVHISPLPAGTAEKYYECQVFWAKKDVRAKNEMRGEGQITTGLLLIRRLVSFDIKPHVYCCGTKPDKLDPNFHNGEKEQAEFARLEKEGKIFWIW